MPVRINNIESNVSVAEGENSGGFSENQVERIVQLVMQRLKEEQNLQVRMDEETRITNKVSKKDLFD